MIMTLPSIDRRIQSLFPVALASFLILGTAQLVLDAMKSNHSQIQQLFYSVGREENRRLPVVLSKKDRMDEGCNVFEGQWVLDNKSYPLYTEESCLYLVKQVTCQRNGRLDSLYKNWRWQPRACNLPRNDFWDTVNSTVPNAVEVSKKGPGEETFWCDD